MTAHKNPKEVVKAWVDAFNRVDIEGLASLYHRDAVNHQVAYEKFVGRDKIRELFAMEFKRATMVCQVENLFEDGEWAILEWSDPLGLRGCGFFQVKDGLIVFQRGYFDKLSFFKAQGIPLQEALK